MIKKIFIFSYFFTCMLYADFDHKISNTNITVYENAYSYNYDRLRFESNYKDDGFFSTLIVDGVDFFGAKYTSSNEFEYLKQLKSDTVFNTQSTFKSYDGGSLYAKIYRLYGGYEDRKNRVVAGLQNIVMGVGRIWTPTNLFNPKNSYAIESDEVFGVTALSYTRYLDDTSHITFVISQKEDKSFKYAIRYKALSDIGDVAFNVVSSNEVKMAGYEIEGDLLDTGIELRSEGAYIKKSIKMQNKEEERKYFQAIVGADYAFVNGLNLIVEALYSSNKFLYKEILLNFSTNFLSNITYSHKYLGVSLNYVFNIFLDASLLYIESFDDKPSRFIAPSFTYTLNDYNSFVIGAQIQNSNNGEEFGFSDNRYYLKWSLSF